MRKDNSTGRSKIQLRLAMLREVEAPVVLEAYAGLGHIWRACYSGLSKGIAMEKDPARAGLLASQRPSWSIYQGESVAMLRAGVGAHLPVNVLDLDPYGDPWPAVEAFLLSERPKTDPLYLVVNDGLRDKARVGGAWNCATLAAATERFGNDLVYRRYLAVCRWLMQKMAAQADYRLDRFGGYYCGDGDRMAHYLAVLTRENRPGPS